MFLTNELEPQMFTATGKIGHKPTFQTCDNTGKRFSEAELEKRAKTPYVGKVEIELAINGMEIVTMNAVVMNGKTERYVRWAGEKDGDYRNFRIEAQLKSQLERLALAAMHKGVTVKVLL